MKNAYTIKADVVYIEIKSPKYGNLITEVSYEDFERVNDFPNTWLAQYSAFTGTFYAIGNLTVNSRHTTIGLSRWIMQPEGSYEVDHNNHDTLDNRRSNLDVVTHSENQLNPNGAYKSNKIGIRGVSWHKRDQHWRAQIQQNKKKINLGSFKTAAEAEVAVISALQKTNKGMTK